MNDILVLYFEGLSEDIHLKNPFHIEYVKIIFTTSQNKKNIRTDEIKYYPRGKTHI